MRHINKREEPDIFARWKAQANEDWRPTYADLRGNEKDAVHRSLLDEQGFICCYCECEIDKVHSDIEHLKPRNRFPEEQLDYDNLLCSCRGGEGSVRKPHCNRGKGDWYEPDMVSPLQQDCGSYFIFTRDGQMLPANDPTKRAAAEETIRRLNLNCERLIHFREQVLDGVFQSFGEDYGGAEESIEEDLTEEQLLAEVSRIDQFDSNGHLEPFCTAILSVIQQKLALLRQHT